MAGFITIEGIEGSGKSTLQIKLSQFVRDAGYEVVTTREPGATKLGLAIRDLLLHVRDIKLSPTAELMLFLADRAQHVSEIIKPALKRGAIVICDRYIHSTIAYQGYGRGIDLSELERLNYLATGGLVPDLVLLLDLDPEVGLKRASEWTKFEQETLEFHKRIRQGFIELSKKHNQQFTLIDAGSSEEKVFSLAKAAIEQHLRK